MQASLKYDETGFAIASDGTRLFYGVRGQGDPIVLNDGLGCDGFAWTYLQPHLASRHRVIHWHYRGHGRSGPPANGDRIGILDLARDLRSVMDHTHAESAIVLGHSMGTQVALELYRAAPERVKALVLICGSYGKVTSTFHGSDVLKQVLPTLIDIAERHRGLARAIWGRVPARLAFRIARFVKEIDAPAIREEDFAHYVDHFTGMDPNLWLRMLKLAGEHSAEDMLGSIVVPTLVIAAERDTFTPAALAEDMAKRIPGAEHMLLAQGSHAVPVEQPSVLIRRVDEFLEQVEATLSTNRIQNSTR